MLPDLNRCGYNKFYIKKSMLYVCQNKVTAGYFSLQYFDLSSWLSTSISKYNVFEIPDKILYTVM